MDATRAAFTEGNKRVDPTHDHTRKNPIRRPSRSGIVFESGMRSRARFGGLRRRSVRNNTLADIPTSRWGLTAPAALSDSAREFGRRSNGAGFGSKFAQRVAARKRPPRQISFREEHDSAQLNSTVIIVAPRTGAWIETTVTANVAARLAPRAHRIRYAEAPQYREAAGLLLFWGSHASAPALARVGRTDRRSQYITQNRGLNTCYRQWGRPPPGLRRTRLSPHSCQEMRGLAERKQSQELRAALRRLAVTGARKPGYDHSIPS